MEPLGNLSKGYTVRNTRGLPFNAPYACTGMDEFATLRFLSFFSYRAIPQSRTPPGGGPSLAYPPYLLLESKAGGG